jgi:branched-chain amino acid transport system substrate-binding protein
VKKSIPGIAFLFALLASCACSSRLSVKPTVKIGLVAPFEGLHRPLGYEALYGAKLAIRERNRTGGVAGYFVELVALNDDQQPASAAQRAREMVVDPDVMGVIGHLGELTTLAALPVYQESDLALVVPFTSRGALTGDNHAGVFSLSPEGRVVGAVAARYAVLEAGAARMAIVEGEASLAESFVATSRSLGSEVQVLAGPPDGDCFADLVSGTVDLVFLAGEGIESAELVRELREAGAPVSILGGPSLDTPEFVQVAGEAALGTVYLSLSPPLSHSSFGDAYEREWGSRPGPRAALSYDATGVMLEVLARCIGVDGSPSREGVIEALAGLRDYEGATGHISFDPKGQAVERPIYLYEIVALEYPGALVSCPSCAP